MSFWYPLGKPFESKAVVPHIPVVYTAVEGDVMKFNSHKEGSNVKDDIKKGVGVKCSSGKRNWNLLDLKLLRGIVDVLTLGAAKYSPDNWKRVPVEEYEEALMRHWDEYRSGVTKDKDDGMHPLYHLGCCLIFIIWHRIFKEKNV